MSASLLLRDGTFSHLKESTVKSKKMPLGHYTGGRGHQTLDLQGGTDKPSRGQSLHDSIHGHRLPRRPGRRKAFKPEMISQGEDY